jgi:hypothetical protein
MREEQDKRAMGIKEVEQRKLLKGQHTQEASQTEIEPSKYQRQE